MNIQRKQRIYNVGYKRKIDEKLGGAMDFGFWASIQANPECYGRKNDDFRILDF